MGWLTSHWKLVIGVAATATATLVVALLVTIGVFALERHEGFFAPVWDEAGERVYLMRRETTGIVWGLGWEFFSPPAYTYVLSDRLTLQRLDPASGGVETLETFDGGPLVHRTTRHYRSRIFGFMSARVEPGTDGIDFLARIDVPVQPRSEQWALAGRWTPSQPSGAGWGTEYRGTTASPDQVLVGGVELMTVPGRESFPAAVIAVRADGGYDVLLRNGDFDALYPDGIAAERISERSRRGRIERVRELRRVRSELVARLLSEGLNEGEAELRAIDELEELGYIPKDPRLVATAVDEPPPDLRVFDIPQDYFTVGLFQDIAAAIDAPGAEVRTGTGTYLKYYDDETGPELRAWRNAGNDRFAVRTGDQLYVLEVRRFDR